MTKEQIAKKLSHLINLFSEVVYAYIGGSFNTTLFSENSDLDVVLIWRNTPSPQQRTEVIQSIQNTFNMTLEWSLLDTNEEVIRDALKILDLRKLELYHCDFSTFQKILVRQNEQEGLSFSLANRFPLILSPEIEAFITSYSNNLTNVKQKLYFEIMSSLSENFAGQNIAESILELYSYHHYRALPAQKHWEKIFDIIPQGHLLKNNTVKDWILNSRLHLLQWSNTQPSERLTIAHDFELRKYSEILNDEVFRKVQLQKERLQEYLSWPKHIQSLEDQDHFSKRAEDQWRNGIAYHLQIFKNNIFAGGISVHSLDFKKRSFEFGYWIDQAFEGQGLIHRGLRLLLNEMSSKGWTRAKISSHVSNRKSQKVAERLGMAAHSSNDSLITYFLDI